MKTELENKLNQFGFAQVLVNCIWYAVSLEDLHKNYFFCCDDEGNENQFTYSEIAKVE